MARTVATTRTIASTRNIAAARTTIGAYRLPIDLIDLGVTHYWDFRTAKLGTNSRTVADLIGMYGAQFRGTSAIGSLYPTATYSADLERSNNDFFATSPLILQNGMTAISFFGWIKRESTGAIHHMISHWETSGNQRGARSYITSDTFELALSNNGTATTTYTSTETLTDTASWHFYVMTYDTTNRCVITLDGVNLTTTLTSGSHPASINSSNISILLGANVPSATANFFDGLFGISGICVNKALSTSEKTYLYNLTNKLGGYV